MAVDDQQALRRIDALVAEKVMGWCFDGHNWSFPAGEWQACECSEPNGPPSFTTSWDAAGQVVERMIDAGWEFEVTASAMFHEARFTMLEDSKATSYYGSGETSPRAVCLAALRACGVDVDELAL